ncbi:hypothetical protein HDU99_006435, partial [Rhizoclosmatium hyalinum]
MNPTNIATSRLLASSTGPPIPPAYTSNDGASTKGDKDKDKDKDPENSRHVAAVLAQFTGTAEALGRLVQEKTDLLVVAEPQLNSSNFSELQINYIAPSCMRVIRCTPASLHRKKLSTILHPDDSSLVIAVIEAAKAEKTKKSVYCRVTRMDRVGEYVLMDLDAEWIAPTSLNLVNESTHALLVARVYNPNPIDTIHTLRIQNLQLKHALNEAVKNKVSAQMQHTTPTFDSGPTIAEKTAAAVQLLRELEGSTSWGNASALPTSMNVFAGVDPNDKGKGKKRLEDVEMEASGLVNYNILGDFN